MNGDPSLPEGIRGRVRLFPLPNLVLFPDATQPLHIFEPRCRALTADALDDDRLIAMAMLKPGWEEEYHERPAVHPIVCVGGIIEEERLPDGRFNLLLRGLHRARIVEELPTGEPYRIVRAQVVMDVPIASPAIEQELRQPLCEHISAWFASESAALAPLREVFERNWSLGTLCDVFSAMLPFEIEIKQQLLESIDVERRTRHFLACLKALLATPSAPDEPRRFPPDFSDN